MIKEGQIKREILELIADHEGAWSWYQLDRALAHGNNLPLLHRLGEFLRSLIEQELIREDGHGAYPRLFITEQGRAVLTCKSQNVILRNVVAAKL